MTAAYILYVGTNGVLDLKPLIVQEVIFASIRFRMSSDLEDAEGFAKDSVSALLLFQRGVTSATCSFAQAFVMQLILFRYSTVRSCTRTIKNENKSLSSSCSFVVYK